MVFLQNSEIKNQAQLVLAVLLGDCTQATHLDIGEVPLINRPTRRLFVTLVV